VAQHFSTIADRRKTGTLDALLLLRDPAATALSVTTSSTAIAVDCRKVDHFRVVLSHQAISTVTPGTAEWVVTIEIGATQSGSFTILQSQALTGTASEYEFGFTGSEVEDKLVTAAWMRVTATKTGSPGTLSFGAWILP
jgi:hypothetical protein